MRFLNKRNIVLLIAIVALTVLFDYYRLYRKTYDELNVAFKDQKIEYGSDISALDLIVGTYGELTVDQDLDTFQVGEQELIVTAKAESPRYRQTVSRTCRKTYEITDTQAPVIEFKKDTVVKYVGTDYDPKDNIERVYDVIDGDLEDYTVSGDYDLQSTGIYTVTVSACDKNGVTGEASYSLVIKNKIIMNTNDAYQYIYDRLTGDYGFSRAAACGILANMSYESSFNPTAGDYYYGLIQWGGGRRDSLVSWCNANGYEYDTIDGQLAFMYHELTGGYRATYDFLMSVPDTAQGAYDAGEYFCRYYEVAASVAARPDLAATYFNGE